MVILPGLREVILHPARGSGSIGRTTREEASMMNDASTPTGQPPAVSPAGKLAYATPATAPLMAGRRSFFKYRDLGVTAASSGKMRAQVTIGADGMTQPTGWHYHVCEGQFVYMLSGWVDLEFEDGQKLRVKAGESVYIPGGMRHNETGASRDLEVLEISVPADMGTVTCDPPEGWPKGA
jgi:mannose-6-phosphate isomerase-like protein (cupin superfamily)